MPFLHLPAGFPPLARSDLYPDPDGVSCEGRQLWQELHVWHALHVPWPPPGSATVLRRHAATGTPSSAPLAAGYAHFNATRQLPNFVERDGKWHHLAATWTREGNGLTQVPVPAKRAAGPLGAGRRWAAPLASEVAMERSAVYASSAPALLPRSLQQIYWDGLLIASATTGQTRPLQPGGALMLGAEQDCYGGCTDRCAEVVAGSGWRHRRGCTPELPQVVLSKWCSASGGSACKLQTDQAGCSAFESLHSPPNNLL